MTLMNNVNPPEYFHAVSLVLPYNPLIKFAKHRFTRPVDRYWRAVWRGRSSDGLDHQAVILGTS